MVDISKERRFFIQLNDDKSSYDLVDRTTGEVVFNDAMEPEDAVLPRDLFPLVQLLNQLAGNVQPRSDFVDGNCRRPGDQRPTGRPPRR